MSDTKKARNPGAVPGLYQRAVVDAIFSSTENAHS